ncbi:MFS transporter [Corynebacterium sp. YIM 101645]|uniref:MFS transporter n=1 Tax=Corynebacterium lemuris TaxID=1859292 RepID=A0ABT2FSP7_9CORY|nr:MFS transporter [Corynebacterium lemuris]MCS5478242.1 MFS transporter [Corynebacterium lemuris]
MTTTTNQDQREGLRPHLADSTSATAPPTMTRREKLRVIQGVGIGNALEWFDWTSYTIFAAYFAGQFFVAENPTTALLGTFAVFAAGFLMRPLGGLFFGWLADRRGRRGAMTLAMIITALGSMVIGISPTYEFVGAFAAAFLLAGRLLQGLGHGGEVVSSFTYVTEMAPADKRGRWSSTVFVFVTLGVTTATLLGALLTAALGVEAVSDWAWRIPFILGGFLGVYALYLRRNLDETPMFEQKHDPHGSAADTVDTPPRGRQLWREIWRHRNACLRIMALAAAGTVLYYVWAIQAPAFAIGALGMPPGPVMWIATAANLFFIACLAFWGWFSDRVGRKANWYIFALGGIVLTIPLTLLLTGGEGELWRLAVFMFAGMVLIAAPTAIMPAFFPEQFPTRIRAIGMGVPYSVAAALTGGTSPYLQTWLYDIGAPRVFDIYLIILCALVLVATWFAPETKGKPLPA